MNHLNTTFLRFQISKKLTRLNDLTYLLTLRSEEDFWKNYSYNVIKQFKQDIIQLNNQPLQKFDLELSYKNYPELR